VYVSLTFYLLSQDDVGRMMWKTHFLNLDFAPWEAFVIGTHGSFSSLSFCVRLTV
jgi:hypothetical protein